MTYSDRHLDVEQLSDFVDDRLTPDERGSVAAHLDHCAACAAQLAKLRSLLHAAGALPNEIEPPAELWSNVRARVVAPKRRWLAQTWLLAAAAVVLIAATATVTTLVVRRPTVIVIRPSSPTVMTTSAMLPPPARSVDADYATAIRELSESLAQNRDNLDPATIAKVEQSLHVIDLAIAEARRALADDPANATLLHILAANYERKVELLRRANELPPST